MNGDYFYLPLEHVMFGQGSIDKLGEEVLRLGGQRVLIITGKSLANQTGVVKKIEGILGPLHAGTFAGIRQHTPASDVEEAVHFARSLGADILVSAGGGSPVDAAKAICKSLAGSNQKTPPHIAVPTTLSAAEFSQMVGITNEKHLKGGFVDIAVTPRTVILDPALTLETPMQLWLASGIRALDHAVETLYAPGVHPVNDVLALEAIKKLFKYLPMTRENPRDLEARLELQLAAWFSFFGVGNVRMGWSHDIGKRIGAPFNVMHGITSCIVLPHIMRELTPRHSARLAKIGEVLGINKLEFSEIEASYAAADAVADLVQRSGLPHRLSEVGLQEKDLAGLTAGIVELGIPPKLAGELVRKMW